MKRLALLVPVIAALVLCGDAAFACSVTGLVLCDVNENGQIDLGVDTPFDDVRVVLYNDDGDFIDDNTTRPDGSFWFSMPEPAEDVYHEMLDLSTLPDDVQFIVPNDNLYIFEITETVRDNYFIWLVDSEICHPGDDGDGMCWMTGGGVKFSDITDSYVAEKGPRHNMGGNVYPGCNSDSGADGGHWNHVAHPLKLHFKGNPITDVVCGNVDGIPPGSTSPVTPYNFIEFSGTGSLKGIKNNDADYPLVYFWARVEDRNEPGSSDPNAGDEIDRYFLHVFADPGAPHATTLLLIDEDGDSTTVDPVMITGGNLQLHDNPCPPGM
jgi:hypothetical protein